MIIKSQRSEVVRYWWSKAQDSLASARREFEAGSYSFTMNRLYYAASMGFVQYCLKENNRSKSTQGFVCFSSPIYQNWSTSRKMGPAI